MVVTVDLSLFVREGLLGKVLDLLAARVVQVTRPLHLGLWSGRYSARFFLLIAD